MRARSDPVIEEFAGNGGRGVGYAALAVVALLVIDVLIEWRTWSGLTAAASALVFASVVWIGLVRPTVRAYADRLVLRNFFRDVHVPWHLVDDVHGRRALVVDAAGVSYTSVAVTLTGPDRRFLRRRIGTPSSSTVGSLPMEGPEPLPGETAAQAREREASGVGKLPPLVHARSRLRELSGELGPSTRERAEKGEGALADVRREPVVVPVVVGGVSLLVAVLTALLT